MVCLGSLMKYSTKAMYIALYYSIKGTLITFSKNRTDASDRNKFPFIHEFLICCFMNVPLSDIK